MVAALRGSRKFAGMSLGITRRRAVALAGAAGAGACAAGAAWTLLSRSRDAAFFREWIGQTLDEPEPAPARPDPASWSDNAVTMAWLGHATVLINFYGVWIATDPALLPRVGLSLGPMTFGPKRLVAAGLRPEELPPLDLILISHAHMDHLDLPTLRRLGGGARVVTARATRDLFATTRFRDVTELGWGGETLVRTRHGGVWVAAFEVSHWGARWRGDTHRGYNGYVLEREGRRIVFGGDTAKTGAFRALRRYGRIEAAIMPIGAYDPWIRSHCTPEEAVAMANDAGAERVLPVHHRTFRLSDEPMDEPLERLRAALRGEEERAVLGEVGAVARIA